MHAWEAIQKTLDYIEVNLSDPLKPDTLSEIAALSPFYFRRLFTRLVRCPVSEYIKLRRLARASDMLKQEGKRILDIALECGFCDHAGFTRAFKTAYGITPEQYRAEPCSLNQFVKPELLLHYVMVDEDVPLITDGIVVEVKRTTLTKERLFLGVAGAVSIEELSGGTTTGVSSAGLLWDKFHRNKQETPGLLPSGNELGVLYMGDADPGYCTYFAGGEVQDGTEKGEHAAFVLPCGEYVRCCFEAENFEQLVGSAVFLASEFMGGWLKKHDICCGDFAAELYFDTSPDGCYMEQWMPIV